MNSLMHVSLPLFLWERFLEVVQLGQRVNTQDLLLDTAKFPCIGFYHFAFPSSNYESICSPKSCQRGMMSKFWGFADVVGKKLHLNTVLICISLIVKEVEHFFHMSKNNLHLFFNNLSDYVFSENFYRVLVLFFSIFSHSYL